MPEGTRPTCWPRPATPSPARTCPSPAPAAAMPAVLLRAGRRKWRAHGTYPPFSPHKGHRESIARNIFPPVSAAFRRRLLGLSTAPLFGLSTAPLLRRRGTVGLRNHRAALGQERHRSMEAPDRSAPSRRAPARSASVRLAPARLALARLAPAMLDPDRSAPRKSALAICDMVRRGVLAFSSRRTYR